MLPEMKTEFQRIYGIAFPSSDELAAWDGEAVRAKDR